LNNLIILLRATVVAAAAADIPSGPKTCFTACNFVSIDRVCTKVRIGLHQLWMAPLYFTNLIRINCYFTMRTK